MIGVFYQRNRQKSIEELVEPQIETLFPFAFGMTLEEYLEYPMFGQDSYINQTKATETQLAAFADVTWSITDQLKLIAGARYAKAKYSFVNFAAEYEINSHLTIFGRIDNLADEKYAEVFGFPALGRAAYGGLRVSW